MYRLIQFFKRYYVLLLFIVFEAAAINFYVASTNYTRARSLAASTRVTGWVSNVFASVGDYFTLRRDNRLLLERLAEVENELERYQVAEFSRDSMPEADYSFDFVPAKVISNSIGKQENYFVVNKGLRDGVANNSAVLSIEGAVVGYVQETSDRFSVCMSILNRDFRLGGKVLGREHFGSVSWDGTDPRYVTLSDIPRYAVMEEGDTVLSAYSSRFPDGSMIGTIGSYTESEDGTYYEIKVRLAARMTVLSDVMIVRYADSGELDGLAGEYMTDRPRPVIEE